MFNRRTLVVAAATITIPLIGCGGVVPDSGESVQVNGRVVGPAGKSINGFNVFFQPTGGKAQQVQFQLGQDGGFSGQMVTGSYTYYLVPGKGNATEKVLDTFPETYRQGSLDRQIEVKGGSLELAFK